MTFITNDKLSYIKVEEFLKISKLVLMPIIKGRTLKLYGHRKYGKLGLFKICIKHLIIEKRRKRREN